LADTIISSNQSRTSLLTIAAGGVLTGLLTPLLPTLIDKLVGAPGDLRIALVAVPFAVWSEFWYGGLAPIHGGRRWPRRSSRWSPSSAP
jgi:hypothetical protein